MTPDKPNPYVFDLSLPEAAIREHFSKNITLIHELCCYGSNLLLRCHTQKGNKLEDVVLIGCLFRQFLVHLDAVYTLLSKGAVDASLIHLRAMLEEQFYLTWILKQDTASRSRHLYVWNLRKRRGWNNTVDPSTNEAKDLDSAIGAFSPATLAKLRVAEHQTAAANQNAEIDKILSQPDLADINKAFNLMRGKKPFDPDWYAPCGPKSLFKIATDVGMIPHYKMFYSKWSESMHSAGFFEHTYTDENGTSIEQIRSLERISESLRMAPTMAFAVFRIFLDRYRSGEAASFTRKYLTEWRDRFLRIPEVLINRKTRA